MANPEVLGSPLAQGISRYLAVKRALGRKFLAEERTLRLLDRFLVQRGVTRADDITLAVIDEFLASRPRHRPRSFNQLLGNVRRLFSWLTAQGDLELPVIQLAHRHETSRRVPFIFDVEQARRLLDAAQALPDRSTAPQRGPTYRTLFSVLYGLGLRVGEACALACDDVDLKRGVLVVIGGKFGKSRLVPFGPRMGDLLRAHLVRRADLGHRGRGETPLFTFNGRRSIHPGTASLTFLRLVRELEFPVPDGVARPRLHDLRHSFAVGTLLRWYRSGVDPNTKLHHLSTFLGHVDPVSTSVYVTMTASLLQEASHRFEDFATVASAEVER